MIEIVVLGGMSVVAALVFGYAIGQVKGYKNGKAYNLKTIQDAAKSAEDTVKSLEETKEKYYKAITAAQEAYNLYAHMAEQGENASLEDKPRLQ